MLGQGLLRRTRAMRLTLPNDIQFAKGKASRRMTNMMEEDRIKFYNWNLACIGVTTVPIAYWLTVNYNSSPDTDRILRILDPDARQHRILSRYYGVNRKACSSSSTAEA